MSNDSDSFHQHDLNNFLNTRRELDFALKLALGSQTNLHQISILQQDSASISSLDHQLSPYKSQSKYNTKKSRFASKQNLNQLDIKIMQKAASIKPQVRSLKQRWYKTVSWANFISKHFKLSNLSSQDLSLSQVNTFFKDVVYKLQKIQQLETQQYNTKFILCQLTEMTLKKQLDAQKIRELQKQVQKQQTTIQELQNLIAQMKGPAYLNQYLTMNEDKVKEFFFNKSKKSQKQPSPKLYSKFGTQSLVFSISQEGNSISSSFAQINQKNYAKNQQSTADKSMMNPDCNQLNQDQEILLISSTQFSKQVSIKQIKSKQQGNNDLKQVKTNLQNKFTVIQEGHQQLRPYQQESALYSVQNSINKSKIQYSRGLLQNSLSKQTINMEELLQIKQEMMKILQQNQFLRQKIKLLKIQFEKNGLKQNSVMNSTKQNLHYDQSISMSINQLKMQHESVIKQKQFLNQYNQNLKQYVEEMNLKTHDQDAIIRNLNKQKQEMQSQINELTSQLQHLESVNSSIQEEVQFLRQKIVQFSSNGVTIQTKDEQVQKDISIIQSQDAQVNSQVSQDSSLSLTQKQNSQAQSNKIAQVQELNKKYQKQNIHLKQKYQKLKQLIYANRASYEKMKQKLLKKSSQLKQIKILIKQAKRINQSDMKKLEQTIVGRKILKEKQVQQLKVMEEAWKSTLTKSKYQKSQSQAPKLQLTNNRFRMIASMKSKGKHPSKNKKQQSLKKQMQKIVEQKKSFQNKSQDTNSKEDIQNQENSKVSEQSLLIN